MIFTIFFAFWRFMEIITLIPTLGMLSYFVNIYATHNALTPNYILVLFIVSVLACVWAICTIFTYHRSRSNSLFVSFVDICIVGALIAGVYELRFIGHSNCSTVSETNTSWAISGDLGSVSLNGHGVHVSVDKTCSMLKASWAFGIMNIIFFAFTSFLALFIGNKQKEVVVDTHYSRHGHRRGSHHSQRSHRSSHSGRRSAYV